jgi:hypothetical protein
MAELNVEMSETQSLAQTSIVQASALIAIAERLDTLIGIQQAETGYGPIEDEQGSPNAASLDYFSRHPLSEDELPY